MRTTLNPDEIEDEAAIVAKIFERSGLIDAPWYLERYPDVAASGMDPLTHFIQFGWTEGRRPNFYFDPVWYLDSYRGDGGPGGNPLLHYIVQGEREGARPSPHFDPKWYREAFGLDLETSPLGHFLARRTSGLGNPLPGGKISGMAGPVAPPPVFSIAPLPTYAEVETLLGVERGDAPPESISWEQATEVIRLFAACMPVDEAWYRQANPDVEAAIQNGEFASATDHFVSAGYFDRRANLPADVAAHDLDGRDLNAYVHRSLLIPGFTRGIEAETLAGEANALPDGARIVEIGSFLGSGSVLLAGARKLQGSGIVHCIDPFDASGDDFSVPFYRAILGTLPGGSQRFQFEDNIHRSGLKDWVRVHQGTAEAIAQHWNRPIDLLFVDGDQSPSGARSAYLAWAPWLKVGGIIALHNSAPHEDEDDHDGHWRVAREFLVPPQYADIRVIGTTTFATRAR